MVCNATFNNISAISWRSVLLVEEPVVTGEKYQPVTGNSQTLSHNGPKQRQRQKTNEQRRLPLKSEVNLCDPEEVVISFSTICRTCHVTRQKIPMLNYAKLFLYVILSVTLESQIFTNIFYMGINMGINLFISCRKRCPD